MFRNVAIVFCLLVYWNICCHGEEEGEGGKTESLNESDGSICKDVNPHLAIMKREISVSTVKENSTGDWVTTFQADRDLDDSTTAVNLKIRQELVRCGEDNRKVLRITGVMRDNDGESFFTKLQNTTIPETKEEKKDISVNVDTITSDCGNILRFDTEMKERNVMISNNGTTASRIELENLDAGVLTERPLNDGEIFSIRIDKSESYAKMRDYSPTFGLLLNPTQHNLSWDYIYGINGTWLLRWDYALSDTTEYGVTKKAYSLHMMDIPDGTVLGVTRKSNGDVHFFKNGLDMGKAFEGVPQGAHGFFNVIHYVTQISVVNEKC